MALAKLGRYNEHVVALDGDTKNSTFSELFKNEHPNRYVECYIAEQNMVRQKRWLSFGLVPEVTITASGQHYNSKLTEANNSINALHVTSERLYQCRTLFSTVSICRFIPLHPVHSLILPFFLPPFR